MKQDSNYKRFQSIYSMLFEMASGNFNFKIQRSDLDDELEAIVVLLNLVAEELRAFHFYQGYVNPHFTVQYLVQHTIILTSEFKVENCSVDFSLQWKLSEMELRERSFESFLTNDSVVVWTLISGLIVKDPNFHVTVQLNFKTNENLIIPSFCTITRLLHNSKILISSVNIIIEESILQNPVLLNTLGTLPEVRANHDSKLMQRVYDYILNHLEEPLPTVQDFSKMFGTNEYNLKEGFRFFFNTSIYQFYNDERLKRAHLIIQQTTVTLKTIAFMCGFSTYSAFSKAFKKKFGYHPKSIVRAPLHITTPRI